MSAALPSVTCAASSVPERQHEAHAGREVVRERMTLDDAVVVRRDPDRLGFRDEVADRHDEAVVADDHAVAGALGAEHRRGIAVLGNVGREAHDALQRLR
jgi:hypothetical protein